MKPKMKFKDISKLILAALFAVLIIIIYAIDAINGTISSFGFYRTIEGFSNSIINNDAIKGFFLGINSLFSGFIDTKGYYNDIGIYIDDDYYIYSPSKETSTDYETRQTLALKEHLDKMGINLIYVNAPTKYLDDHILMEKFGAFSYSNRNADTFLKRISDAGVNVVDLREDIRNEGLEISQMFYRTDHHWTVDTGFWAAKKIVESLNKYSGYNVDLSIFDKDKYNIRKWEKCWIGEQGNKFNNSSLSPDDFTNISPKFPTSFHFKEDDTDGDFGCFYDESVYTQPDSIFKKYSSWHYSYRLLDVINNSVDSGKILLVCDSYSYVSEPFIALAVNSVDNVILRSSRCDLLELLDVNNDYDTVVICYAQFMIGAHDDPDSANYKMFTFDSSIP